jgi:hypothetical protein
MSGYWAQRGQNLSSMFRTGTRRYSSRPPANCRTARDAWDHFSKTGPVVWLQLLDGYWGAMRENGDIEETENTFAAWRSRRERANV